VLLRVFLILLWWQPMRSSQRPSLRWSASANANPAIDRGWRIGARTVLKLHQQIQRVVNGVQLE